MFKTVIAFSEPEEETPESGRFRRRLVDNEESAKQETVNDFMRKKTEAQGLINFALLGANAAQLKRILTSSKEYDFFTFLIVLIGVSITLQIVQLVVMCIIGMFLDMNIRRSHPMQIVMNNLLLMLTTLCLLVNVLLSALDMAD